MQNSISANIVDLTIWSKKVLKKTNATICKNTNANNIKSNLPQILDLNAHGLINSLLLNLCRYILQEWVSEILRTIMRWWRLRSMRLVFAGGLTNIRKRLKHILMRLCRALLTVHGSELMKYGSKLQARKNTYSHPRW